MDPKEKNQNSGEKVITDGQQDGSSVCPADGDKKKEMTGPAESSQGLKWIRAIVDMLEDSTQVKKIEVEWGDVRIRAEKHSLTPTQVVSSGAGNFGASPGSEFVFSNHSPHKSSADGSAGHVLQVPSAPVVAAGHCIKSPMVGTAYLAPKPGEAPFISVGSIVQENQTIVIIEAMKTMNSIKASVSGKVTEILVRDGQPVEFDQVLVRIQ